MAKCEKDFGAEMGPSGPARGRQKMVFAAAKGVGLVYAEALAKSA
jgi:hypothetical protein